MQRPWRADDGMLVRLRKRIIGLASEFLCVRGSGPAAPWPYGDVLGGIHIRVPGGVLTTELLTTVFEMSTHTAHLVVTPWHGILIPGSTEVRR
ncbi:hypothetical protein AFA91_20130 [Mycolicibacterium goodii]|uniref:Uncharacterized protein n=1 Tax=Mycolicibacterium goodii TaxID=134601 RepID=A0A0K0X8X9_MYCGD|nr:hypothetical protein AFA91_20130 [Mycolicibacterium goodii]